MRIVNLPPILLLLLRREREEWRKMGIARKISGMINGNASVFLQEVEGIDDWWEIGGERKRGAAVFSPLESGREPIQWCVYAARNCWASICEINEFHNVLTTFTVKTKSRLRGWIGGGKDVTRAENGAGWSGRSRRRRGGRVEAAAVVIPLPCRRGEGGLDALRLAICEFWWRWFYLMRPLLLLSNRSPGWYSKFSNRSVTI